MKSFAKSSLIALSMSLSQGLAWAGADTNDLEQLPEQTMGELKALADCKEACGIDSYYALFALKSVKAHQDFREVGAHEDAAIALEMAKRFATYIGLEAN